MDLNERRRSGFWSDREGASSERKYGYGMSFTGAASDLQYAPRRFHNTGHFIVLVGVKDGQIQVNDPNSRERSEKLWDWSTLEYQITNLWAFSKN